MLRTTPNLRRRLVTGFGLTAVTVLAGGAIAPTSGAAHAAAPSVRLMVDFAEGDPLTAGSTVHDVSGFANNGVVKVGFGGRILPTDGGAAFPRACSAEPCPNAMINVTSSSSLNPGRSDVEWGATVRLAGQDTADGENVIQKGRWGEAAGMWKLQVDKAPGKPSCVVSGASASGGLHVIIVKSAIGIADGQPHRVVCRRVGRSVTILVDGVERGVATAPIVDLGGTAPVTIGAKEVQTRDNDQFQGTLHDVYMAVL